MKTNSYTKEELERALKTGNEVIENCNKNIARYQKEIKEAQKRIEKLQKWLKSEEYMMSMEVMTNIKIEKALKEMN